MISNSVIKKVSIILVFFNLYIFFNILFGFNNIVSYYKTKQLIEVKTKELGTIIKKNEEYKKEIEMLQKNTLDKDYLEELVRMQLNYSYPDEKVIIYNNNKII